MKFCTYIPTIRQSVRFTAAISGLSLIMLAGCESKQQDLSVSAAPVPASASVSQPQPPVPVQSSNIRDYTTSGPLVVEQQANVDAERDGRVTTVHVDLGDRVHRGEVLATLDDRAPQADYTARAAHLESLHAQLHEWQAEQRGAEVDLRRSESLFQSKIISVEEVEHVRSRMEQTVAEVSRYKLDSDAAEAELHAAKIALEGSRVTAPFDGVVARRSVRAAQQVKKGDELFWVTAEAPLHIVFTVPEAAMEAFRSGALLELDSASLPALHQPAKIVKVSPVVDPASGSIEVNALLEHPAASLKTWHGHAGQAGDAMNLSEALDAALPELPRTRLATKFAPRLDPEVVVREDILDGMRSVSILQRSSSSFARLTPDQWGLLQLFDGERSYEEIAEVATVSTGTAYAESDLREFAEGIEQCGFWYKSPQEKNLAMSEKLATHRCRRQHGGGISLAHISFSAWDPDRYLSNLDRRIGKYIYSGWFTAFAVLLFAFEATVFAVKWSTFGPDVHLYYQFAEKTSGDLLEFWLLFFILGFLHETAHGLTCKHFGGQVHSMGFLLLYLTPAFFCDITEVWVSATRGQRLAAIIAGIWTELIVCGIATVVWTNTLPGQWQHDISYKLMLLTGVAVVVLNVNPLLKLDGYYFLTEWLRIPDLKERSTGFVSASVQKYIFRMDVEVPMVSINRAPFMVAYAVASGAYSYFMLYAVIRLAYNISYHFVAELALVPAAALTFAMFRSRFRTLREFLSRWFRTHRDAGGMRLSPLKILLAALILAALFVPIWRDREDSYYVIEPAQAAIVHAAMPGRITDVFVHEGQTVQVGQILATASSLDDFSSTAESHALLVTARQRLYQAELSHEAVGAARTEAEGATRQNALAVEQHERLSLIAPFAGTIVSPGPESLVGQTTATGQPLLTVADTSHLRARIYLPGPGMAHVSTGDEIVIEVPSRLGHVYATLGNIDGPATPLPSGVIEQQQFAGTRLADFYSSVVSIGTGPEGQGLRLGMSGRAKVFGKRRSLLTRIAMLATDLLRTHFW